MSVPDRETLLADPVVQKVAEAICPGSYRDMPTIWLVRAHRAIQAVREHREESLTLTVVPGDKPVSALSMVEALERAEHEAESPVVASQWCPIGSLNLHSYNHERTECIWCGPGRLAWQPGRWVPNGDGTSAWSATTE